MNRPKHPPQSFENRQCEYGGIALLSFISSWYEEYNQSSRGERETIYYICSDLAPVKMQIYD